MRARRLGLGLTQAAVAERVGVGRRWMIDLEAGRPGLEVGLVLRVVALLGLELVLADVGTDLDAGLLDDIVGPGGVPA
jgi:transcriptional regulator with XRE-family HTH domain